MFRKKIFYYKLGKAIYEKAPSFSISDNKKGFYVMKEVVSKAYVFGRFKIVRIIDCKKQKVFVEKIN